MCYTIQESISVLCSSRLTTHHLHGGGVGIILFQKMQNILKFSIQHFQNKTSINTEYKYFTGSKLSIKQMHIYPDSKKCKGTNLFFMFLL